MNYTAVIVLKDEPEIDFYDADQDFQKFTKYGQFVSSYYVSTLTDDRESLERTGLNLDGGVDGWELTGNQMKDVFRYLDILRR